MPRLRLALLVVAVVAGCGGGMQPGELPADPLAFVRQEPHQGLARLENFRESLSIRAETAAEYRRRQQQGRRASRPRTTLMLLTLSSGEMKPVPDAGEGTLPLDWSHDGSRLLIGRVEPQGGPIRLFTWNRRTGGYERANPDHSAGGAALGAGPILLASVRRQLTPGGTATAGVIVYTEGQGAEPLPAGVGGTDPDIGPDGRTVLFVRPAQRLSQEPMILVTQHGEDSARALARGETPRFSRDGRWIVFTRKRAGDSDVWLMRANGSGKRPVASSGFVEEFPAISPEGDYVIYASARGREEESQLYLTRVADGVEIQITQNGHNGRPVW